MLKVAFLSFYNDLAIGVNVLSSLLIEDGHQVSVIYFKLPTREKVEWSPKRMKNMEFVDPYADVVGTNAEVSRWTQVEMELLDGLVERLESDILAVSFRSTDKDLVLEVLPRLRGKVKGIILAGGYGPTLDPEAYVDVADYVFIGEAEKSIQELAARVDRGESLDDMDNLCFRRGRDVVRNPLGQPEISQFKRTLQPHGVYWIENGRIVDFEHKAEVVKTHTYSTFAGRGCVKACTYCSAGQWHQVYRGENLSVAKRRNRPVGEIIDELKLAKDPDITFVLLRDSFLSASTSWLKEFFTRYGREIGLPFWAYLVPKQMIENPDILRMAVDAGFVDTEIGIQSGSERVNRTYFKRSISLADTVRYARMLADYDINMRYDIIIFNPAETWEDVNEAFGVIQALPKKRSYLLLPILKYFPRAPIVELMGDLLHREVSDEEYYCIALLYLLCFVLPKDKFAAILADEAMRNDWRALRVFYKEYIARHGISFPVGTHEVAESITTPRYKRIMANEGYSRVLAWKDDSYYADLAHVFEGAQVTLIEPDPAKRRPGESGPEVLDAPGEDRPLFVCHPAKQAVKRAVLADHAGYRGRLIV